MRIAMIFVLSLSVVAFGCHKKLQVDSVLTGTSSPPPTVVTPSGPVPALPSDNSQIPSQVIVSPPADKNIKK